MIKKENNFAYIDGSNLHKGVLNLGWELDYTRFRVWLREKYSVQTAYLFLGLMPKYKDRYVYLQKSGYTLVFKEVVYDGSGSPKGNCDADLVLQSVIDVYDNAFDRAIIVSSDGDYASLIKFLQKKDKLHTILSPSTEEKCSILLKRTNAPIAYMFVQKKILSLQKEKAPSKDGTLQGSLS
jgi:uncharacterized LabA/DUF88 family protein